MQTVRLFPALNVALQNLTINGRAYASTPGNVVDVIDADAGFLAANGWIRVAPSGTSLQRPGLSLASGNYGVAAAGTYFYDSTVGKLIIFDGAKWRSPNDGSAV